MKWNNSKVFVWTLLISLWNFCLSQVIYNNAFTNIPTLSAIAFILSSLILAGWIIVIINESWDA